jgi:hypothetical protein
MPVLYRSFPRHLDGRAISSSLTSSSQQAQQQHAGDAAAPAAGGVTFFFLCIKQTITSYLPTQDNSFVFRRQTVFLLFLYILRNHSVSRVLHVPSRCRNSSNYKIPSRDSAQ